VLAIGRLGRVSIWRMRPVPPMGKTMALDRDEELRDGWSELSVA